MEVAKLDVLDPTGKLNSLCELALTHSETMSKMLKNQEILIESLVNTYNYTMMNETFNQIMIGVSINMDVREKNNKRKGWANLGARPGSLKQERMKLCSTQMKSAVTLILKELFPKNEVPPPELVKLATKYFPYFWM